MPHSEARAWWADVQHLKDDYARTDEARRRADEADLASRRATRERRDVDAEVSSVHFAGTDEPADPIAQRRDTTSSARRGHTDGGLDPRRGHHVDMPPAPRVRQGVAPPSGPQRGPRMKGDGTPGRVTVEIRGRTVPAPAVPRPLEVDRNRPQRRAVERVGARPDRVAMWALLMGLMLILVAIGTADAPAASSLLLR